MLAHAGPDAIAFHYVPLHHDSMEVTCTPVLTRACSSWHRAHVCRTVPSLMPGWQAGEGGESASFRLELTFPTAAGIGKVTTHHGQTSALADR